MAFQFDPNRTFTFFVRSDLVVVGRDPEFADVSNPRGEIYGQALYVVAERPNGRRFAHDHRFIASRAEAVSTLARAERLCERIAASFNSGAPLDGAHWVEIDPAYGSDAYVTMDIEAQRADDERRAVEASGAEVERLAARARERARERA